MSNITLIICCGLVTFFTRFLMIAILKKEMFNDRIREVLSFVPAAIFPAIIFPAIFLDNNGFLQFDDNPKILATVIAMGAGLLSNNIIVTIFTGLFVYWWLIFI